MYQKNKPCFISMGFCNSDPRGCTMDFAMGGGMVDVIGFLGVDVFGPTKSLA